MNIVSKLYAENFCNQIGDWCRGRGVEYIGHVLEDNNVHARLGPGTGHFFRSLWGQDMSGLDVVLWQIVPGFDQLSFRQPMGERRIVNSSTMASLSLVCRSGILILRNKAGQCVKYMGHMAGQKA